MEYVAEIHTVCWNEIPNQRDSQQAAKSLLCLLLTRGGLGLIGERRRPRIQLTATQTNPSSHPEVNSLAEPAHLRSLEQAINIKH